MKCLNKLLMKVKSGVIIVLMLMMCMAQTPAFATEIPDTSGGEEQPPVTETANLPHIDMKVKQVKVGDASQVLVECYASRISDLEILDIAFTYNNTVLEPSYINGDNKNEILDELSNIKYENRPEILDPSTGLNIDEQIAFNKKSKEVLSNSFEFADTYKTDLDIFVYQYLAPNGSNEAIKFVINKLTDTVISAGDESVLIGTFSFRKISDADLDGVFGTNYIGITPGSGENEDEIRDIENGENCEDIVIFEYEKYGSISGTIKASIINPKENNVLLSSNIKTLTVKIFDLNDETVKNIDWTVTGINYKNTKLTNSGEEKEIGLPEPYQTHAIQLADDGTFVIPEILFGEYVVLIDKDYYGDFIITNVKINSGNKDIDFSKYEGLEEINIIPGDINNDGIMNQYDSNIYAKDKKGGKANQKINLDDASDRTGINGSKDSNWFTTSYNTYRARGQNTVKKIYNLEGGTYEK